jgi:hypothetical protein
MLKFQFSFVDAFENFYCFGEVSFFSHVEGLKMERRAVIKFCVKLKKTATETFEIWKVCMVKSV